jgi:hypothetical protein
MALETGTYISDLVSTNPTTSDNVSQGDDHLRLIKTVTKATFPNVTGAVNPTHTELNYVVGVTSAIQTQLNSKTSFPTQTGNGGKFLTTDGANTSWAAVNSSGLVFTAQAASSFNAASGNHYLIAAISSAITATLPASPSVNDVIRFSGVVTSGGLTLGRNGKLINGQASNYDALGTGAGWTYGLTITFTGDTYGWAFY